jgi:MOSC domain-containing protein YiiM
LGLYFLENLGILVKEIGLNKCVGKVLKLFISEKGNAKRIEQRELLFDIKGVIGDKFYGKDNTRAVLLTSSESYALANEYQIFMEQGTLGENILIDYNPYGLTMGMQLRMGSVILEIVQNCTICNHLSVVDKKLPKLLKDDRGIFVKVVKEGCVKNNDKVYLLD